MYQSSQTNMMQKDKQKKKPNRSILRSDLALKVTMGCRTNESCNLKRNLGFRLHDVVNIKEQTIINSMKDAFEEEDLQTQYNVLGSRIDFYFHKHKLAIKVVNYNIATGILLIKLEGKKC